MAFETNVWFGATPVFNQIIKKGKMLVDLYLFRFQQSLEIIC